MFDSNPANKDRILVPPSSLPSLALCLHWKHVLERTPIRIAKLYCILTTKPIAGRRSMHFEVHGIAEMAVLVYSCCGTSSAI